MGELIAFHITTDYPCLAHTSDRRAAWRVKQFSPLLQEERRKRPQLTQETENATVTKYNGNFGE